MSRRIPWRRICSDIVSERIERANQARIYLLRETGPTGFLVKEDGVERTFKVFLGDLHSCTCQTFMKEKELCIHILWVLLKKFRVPKENPVVFQLSLVEREINEVIRGCYMNSNRGNKTKTQANITPDSREKLQPREISTEDVCPICQEELLQKSEPLTFCKYGCGNSVHIKCMKIWAEHQRSTGETIVKCPLCRVDFGTFQELLDEFHKSSRKKTRAERQDLHLGAACKKCQACPIAGKCYRCVICADYHLCHKCFATDTHTQHSFHFRQKPSQRWRPVSRPTSLPSAVIEAIQSREISDGDYDLLLQLDRPLAEQDGVPGHVLSGLPSEILHQKHKCVTDGSRCGICLHGYRAFQHIRTLPCQHLFHRDCIDNWLGNHSTCPADGLSVMIADSSHERGGPQQIPGIGSFGLSSRGLPRGRFGSREKQLSAGEREGGPSLPSSFTLSGSGLQVKSRVRNEGHIDISGQQRTHSMSPHSRCSAQNGPTVREHVMFNPLSGKPPIPATSIEKNNLRSQSGDSRRGKSKVCMERRRHSLDKSQRSNSLGDLGLSANGTSVQTGHHPSEAPATRHRGHLRKGSFGRKENSRPSLSDSEVTSLGPIVASGMPIHFPSL